MSKIKRIVSAVLALLMLSMSALLCGCDLFKQGIEYGFDPKGLQRAINIAYKSDTDEFDIDNVKLTFYYGRTGRYDKDEYSYFEIYAENRNNKTLIKRVNEDIQSEKYKINVTYKNFLFYHYSDYEFTYSEEIILPKNIFTNDVDQIDIRIYAYPDDPDGRVLDGFITFFYQINENKVILSEKPF